MKTIFGLDALSDLQDVDAQAADAAANASINSERFISKSADYYSRPYGLYHVAGRLELLFRNLFSIRKFLDDNLVDSGAVHIGHLE